MAKIVNSANSVLVVGFNTRPLVYSLNKAGYEVYAVDFFGDLDLYPYVKDYIIITKTLGADYYLLKDKYKKFLVDFSIEMIRKHKDIRYLIIGSGLDDNLEERRSILNEIEKPEYNIISANNDLEAIRTSRNYKNILKILTSNGYLIPLIFSYEDYQSDKHILQYPFILKKRTGSGGINVFKIESEDQLNFIIKMLDLKGFNPSEWYIQEFIEGIPVSCTTISNSTECEVISINRQIIGLKRVNSPKEFMYCGNIVPANLLKEDYHLISEMAITLSRELGLKGINGFDFVVKDHYPYFMEVNPRIPGSIRVSETALDLNLLDLHIQSFNPDNWENVKEIIKNPHPIGFATKLIMFAPKEIKKELLYKINNLEHVHDKTEPIRNVLQEDPLCTILFLGKNFSDSYFNALKIADEINRIID